MNSLSQLIVNTLVFLMSFIEIRWFLWNVIDYQLNKSARKKRSKDLSFKEWLLYLRFRREIPTILLILYFAIIVLHLAAYLILFLSLFIPPLVRISGLYITILYLFNLVWLFSIFILFGGAGPGPNIGRWIKKRGGNQKKRKK